MAMQKLPTNILELERKVELRQQLLSKEELISLSANLSQPRNLADTLIPVSTKPLNYILSKASAESFPNLCSAALLEPSEFNLVPKLKSQYLYPVIGNWPIIDEYEVWEARALELDAVILPSSLLEYTKLQWMIEVCREAGIDGLFSIKNAAELGHALKTDAKYLIIDGAEVDARWASLQLKRFGRGRQVILSLDEPTRLLIGNMRSIGYNCFHLNTTRALSPDLVDELSVVTRRRSPLERSAPLQRFWR